MIADPAERLRDAERQAVLARHRLSSSVTELQARLDPARLADIALTEVKAAGIASATVADRYRGTIFGVVAAIGLLLIRKPLLRRWRRRKDDPALIDHA